MTWKDALEHLNNSRGGNILAGANGAKYALDSWLKRGRGDEIYFCTISLFIGDDMAEINREYWRGRTTYKIRYIVRTDFDKEKRAYRHTHESQSRSGIIESRKGKAAFFKALFKALKAAKKIDDFCYWTM